MAEPPVSRGAPPPPLVRAGARAFLDLDRFDVVAVVLLVVAAFALRFTSPVYPDLLSHPGRGAPVHADGVGYPYNAGGCTDASDGPGGHTINRCGFVFDEVYFPVDAEKDLHQPPLSYFDPEPPLAKSLMVPPIQWLGFTTWSWRLSTTLAGSLFVGVIYLIARRLRRERFFALAAATAVGLDGLAFVESRTGVIDMIAIFFVALLYYVFLLHWQARTRRQWRSTLYLVAAVAGLALGAKLTALAPLAVGTALVAARWLQPAACRRFRALTRIARPDRGEAQLWRSAGRHRAGRHYAAAAAVTVLIFAACFARYLSVAHDDVYRFTGCTQTGGLQAPRPPTMPAATASLDDFGSAGRWVTSHLGWHPSFPDPLRAVRNIIEKTGADLQYHAVECHRHDYASHWFTWPVMYHPVLFYYASSLSPIGAGPEVSTITDMGNPALWWLGIPALLFCVWRATSGPASWRLSVGALGVASLAVMILRFHGAEVPDTESVRVDPGVLFSLAFGGMAVFSGLVAVSAVLSRRFVPAFIVLGYVTAWMMWVPGNERRILFFYHAMGMLIFLALAFAYGLTALRRATIPWRGRSRSLAPLAHGLLATVVAAFVFFYPTWTAMPLSPADHALRIWVDTW